MMSESAIDRYADGDTPDTTEDNECAGDDCGTFVLAGETYCMSCRDELRADGSGEAWSEHP